VSVTNYVEFVGIFLNEYQGILNMKSDDRYFWLAFRQALLLLIDAIERRLDLHPRTAVIRKAFKSENVKKMVDNVENR